MAHQKKIGSKEKIDVLRKHLQKKEAVSALCKEHGFTPGAFYQWQETLFSRGHLCFETSRIGRPVDEKIKDKRISDLENKLNTKNQIISELMEELLKEKKLAGVI